ncbi:MAG: NADP-dependent oxidoreductase [Chloroflexota bacterium]|nr:NADP-dependent oxidoreductase [Chloroflexota bacterium]
MKAVRIHAYGGNEVLRLDDLPTPAPIFADDVLVRVRSSSVNPVDWFTRAGHMSSMIALPFTLGWDVAGVVEAVGSAVTHVAPGDSVYAMIMMRGGGYAEYALVKASEVARKPASVPDNEAGAIPAVALTAWQALDGAGIVSGQTVLITGGAGGVGTFAVQLAVARGAIVIATASARNHDLLRSLGASEVIDYNTTRLNDAVSGVDAVVDTVGMTTAAEALPTIRRGGAIAGIAGVPDERTAAQHGVRTADIGVEPSRDQLAQIAALIDSGQVRLILDRAVTLDHVGDGFAHSESGHARGKIVIQI